jgi:spore coat polysaccharide biosynthesis predicted glycosyltransferase SpsG
MIDIILTIRPSIRINAIVGDAVDIDEKYNDKVDVYRRLSAEQMVEVFSKSDIGIFSASTICVEAIASKLPVFAGWYVDNQETFYHYGVKHGLFSPLGNLLVGKEKIAKRLLEAFNQFEPHSELKIDFVKQKNKINNIFKKLALY